jgi:class 3 adenylate cyclase
MAPCAPSEPFPVSSINPAESLVAIREDPQIKSLTPPYADGPDLAKDAPQGVYCVAPLGLPQPAGAPKTHMLPPIGQDVPPLAIPLPRHRAIVAVDIEQSTSRPDPVKAELRRTLYELFDQALRSAGINRHHRDRFTDRGDGLLSLIRPVDQAPKPVLLNRVVPALRQLMADYNARLARANRPHQQLRVRVVMHAGEVHYDSNGCFGEALDIAFRLLDAPGVKRALRATADPLTLVISEEIYRTIVRHGYDGIDPQAFRPLIRVHVAGHRYPGWIYAPHRTLQLHATEAPSPKQPA